VKSLATTIVVVAFVTACGGGNGGGTAAETSASGCRAVERPEPRDPGAHEPPVSSLDPSEETSAVVSTNCGEFTIVLDPEAAPNATASFVELATDGYFDDTIFHRIVPGFVIQGGDPTASGTGGPGYTTVDPPHAETAYSKGVVAMAKAGNEPRGAAGSQFFIVTGDDIGLPPDYAVVGTFTDGLDVVERIGLLGDAQEQPTETVLVERIEIERS
jgi:peptidyl-prolyl cis-trans isomerase B (cyclophilin B)